MPAAKSGLISIDKYSSGRVAFVQLDLDGEVNCFPRPGIKKIITFHIISLAQQAFVIDLLFLLDVLKAKYAACDIDLYRVVCSDKQDG